MIDLVIVTYTSIDNVGEVSWRVVGACWLVKDVHPNGEEVEVGMMDPEG